MVGYQSGFIGEFGRVGIIKASRWLGYQVAAYRAIAAGFNGIYSITNAVFTSSH